MIATTPTTAKPQPAWQGIILFVVLTFAISWGIWLGLRAVGVPFTIRTAIGMFGPALAATLVRLIRREGFADAGLRLTAKGQLHAGRMYLAAYVTIPLLIFAGIGIALLTTYQHWALGANLHAEAEAIMQALAQQGQSLPKGISADQLATISFITSTVLAFTFGIPFNMIFTFGEEFGWRGYLLPRLAPLGGVPAALIVGVVWGLWHAPLILLDGYNYPGHPILGVGMMVVFTTALSVIFAWLRFRSGSVWPSTLAHAALNAQYGFGLLLLSTGDSLIRSPIGILGLLPVIALAIWLAVTGRVRAGEALATDTPLSPVA
jgi:membrane protease YdiL (CAAX protease family)